MFDILSLFKPVDNKWLIYLSKQLQSSHIIYSITVWSVPGATETLTSFIQDTQAICKCFHLHLIL